MKKKIAFVLTGGTIGSQTTAQSIDLPVIGPYPLLEKYKAVYRQETLDVDVFCPIQILSENMTADSLHTLMRFLTDLDKTAYSGILIAHGSDTVHFTAALAAHLFADTQIPIVFTCAVRPPDNPNTDAFRNLHLAFQAIRQPIPGVWFAFQNPDGSAFLIDAMRMAPCTHEGAFYDYFGTPAYRICNGHWSKQPHGCPEQINRRSIALPNAFQKVLFIEPYPMLDYNAFQPDSFDCVLHSGYHSFTACCAGENHSVLFFIANCQRHGIPFYFAIPEAPKIPYGTTAQILSTSAIPIYGYTPYAAYTWLLLQK
ncbi:MAG: asparaginase [Clostridia bacterium]|nr:asparaginase [Clostridia bacterium]